MKNLSKWCSSQVFSIENNLFINLFHIILQTEQQNQWNEEKNSEKQ